MRNILKMEINKVYQGDCMELLRQLPNNFVHLVITSPPYNIAKDYGEYKDNMNYDKYIDWLLKVFTECKRVIVEGGRLCINVGYVYVSQKANIHALNTDVRQMLPTYADLIVGLRKAGFTFQEHIIWDKIGNSADNKIVFGSYPFPVDVYARQGTEHILIFKKGIKRDDIQQNRANIKNKIPKDKYFQYVSPIWTFRGTSLDKHCAEFPVELPRRLITMYSFVGDTILDPFMGSGTTAYASKQLERNYLGFELNPKFVALINEKTSQEMLHHFQNTQNPTDSVLSERIITVSRESSTDSPNSANAKLRET